MHGRSTAGDGAARASRLAHDPDALIETIRASVIGDDEAVAGPFGVRRVTYADYTASGRSLTFIEDYIRDAVLPLYANTHTESSGTGLQTTRFREEAREIIRRGGRGRASDHAVIFTGSGSTSAVNKLVGVLGLRIPAELDDRYGLSRADPGRRAAGRLRRAVRAPQQRAAVARVDRRRRRHPRGRRRPHRPGPPGRGAGSGTPTGHCASAASAPRSNVTGIVTDTYGDRPPAPRARRAVVLGLRRGGAVRRDRDGPAGRPARLQGRDLHLAPQVHRRSRHPGRARRPPRAVHQPRPDRPRRRHRRLRQPGRARLPRRHRASRGGRHAGHRRVDPGGPRVRAQGGRRRRGHPGARGVVHPTGDRALGRPSGHRDPRQSLRRAPLDRVASSSATTAATSTTTSSWRCSTTCSASSRAAAARAPGRTAIACSASTSRPRTSSSARSRAAARGSSPAGCGSTSTTSSARRSSSTSSAAVELVARDGWRLLPAVRVRAGDGLWRHAGRPVEPPLSLARHPLRRGPA